MSWMEDGTGELQQLRACTVLTESWNAVPCIQSRQVPTAPNSSPREPDTTDLFGHLHSCVKIPIQPHTSISSFFLKTSRVKMLMIRVVMGWSLKRQHGLMLRPMPIIGDMQKQTCVYSGYYIQTHPLALSIERS